MRRAGFFHRPLGGSTGYFAVVRHSSSSGYTAMPARAACIEIVQPAFFLLERLRDNVPSSSGAFERGATFCFLAAGFFSSPAESSEGVCLLCWFGA